MDSLLVHSTWTILTALMVFVILLVTVDAEAQSTFTVQQVSVIQAEGLDAVFECQHSGAAAYAWFVNGLVSTDPNFPQDASRGGGLRGSPDTLTILASPEYNNAVVQCRAVVEVGGAHQYVVSDNATLSVQGPLEAVSALVVSSRSASSILISWIAPFSLDLTTAEPDIVYCVDIYNVTGGGTELVETKCNIINTSYLFSSDNLSPDHIFNFTVTPVSNVAGSQNGTRSQPVQASTCRGRSNTFSNVEFQSNILLNPMTFTYSTENGADACMPTSYTVVFKNDTGFSANCSANPTVTNSNTSLTFTNSDCTRSISRHSLYNATIIETYMGGIAMLYKMMSTHDVQSPIITNWSQPGQINISANYLDGSTDQGFFCLIYSLSDSLLVFYDATVRENSKDFSITNLPQDEYMVVLYDLEEDSLPRETPAALPQHVTIANNEEITTPSNTLGDLINATSPRVGEIYINCSVTDCVGVIHSMNVDNLTLYHFRNGERVTGLKEGNYSVVLIKHTVSASTGLEFSFYSTTVPVDSPLTTSEPTTTSSVVPQDTAGIIVGVVPVMIVLLVIIIVTAVTAILIVKVFKNNKAKWNPNQPSPDLPIHFQSISMDSPPGYESIMNLASPSQVVTTLNEYEDSPNTYRPILNNETVDLQTNRQESVSEDVPPPVPDHYKPEDIVGCNLNPLVQHGYGSVSSMPSVEEPQQPLESHDSHMEGYVATEPAYDVVAKKVFVKESTNSVPVIDSTATEHQYSEIHGAINKAGLIYAHVTPKTTGPPDVDQMMDSTTVVYSEVIKDKLATKAEVGGIEPQQETVPPIPPPTVESLLLLFDFMCEKWKLFGEALGFREDQLYKYSTEGHDKVRMHEMVQDYFCDPRIQHTWEEFVQPLRTIGEFELADKIDRQYIVQESVPAIPPRPLPALPPKSTPHSVSRPHNGSSENALETQTNSDEADVRSKDEQPSQASEANGEDVSTAFIAPSGTYAEDSSEDEMSTPLFSLGKFNQMTLLKSSLWDDLKSQPKRLAGALGLLNSNGAHFRTSWKKLNGTDCMI